MAEVLTSILYPYKENNDVKISPVMDLCLLTDSLARELTKKMENEVAYLDSYMPGFVNKAVTIYYQQVENYKQNKKDHAVYALRVNNDIVGAITVITYSLLPIETTTKTACVSFFLFDAYQHKGYMLNALRSLLTIYYNEDKVSRFEFHLHKQNHRAMRLVAELGGQFEVELRNLYGSNNFNLYTFVLPEDLIKLNQKTSEIHANNVRNDLKVRMLQEHLHSVQQTRLETANTVITLDDLTRRIKEVNSSEVTGKSIDLSSFGDIADFDNNEFDYLVDDIADDVTEDLVDDSLVEASLDQVLVDATDGTNDNGTIDNVETASSEVANTTNSKNENS